MNCQMRNMDVYLYHAADKIRSLSSILPEYDTCMLSYTSDFVDRGACLQGLLDRSWEAEKGNRVKKHCDFEVSRECALLPGSKCTC